MDSTVERELENSNCARLDENSWRGAYRGIDFRITLPAEFPHSLPIVRIDTSSLAKRIPHVESDGKVCLAPSTGILIDASRPDQIVADALVRLRKILDDGMCGQNSGDWHEEFDAYWVDSTPEIISLCNPAGVTRCIWSGALAPRSGETLVIAADGLEALKAFALRTGRAIQHVQQSYFIRLNSPPNVPSPGVRWKVLDLLALAREQAEGASLELLLRSTAGTTRHIIVIVSFSTPTGTDVCIGLRSTRPVSTFIKGYRHRRTQISQALNRNTTQQLDRVRVQRSDNAFLQIRTGLPSLNVNRSALVVGVGAIGGYLAQCLSYSGFNQLTLIDDERLRAENVLRHFAGCSQIGEWKPIAVKSEIHRRLPQIDIEAVPTTIEAFMAAYPDRVTKYDVIFLATGDMTLELKLSQQLRARSRLVHVWLESYGVGGHVLVDGFRHLGCLNCLFETDPSHGLVCRASFLEPSQDFTTHIGGCAGTFTPFGSLDAQQAAIEATRAAMRIVDESTASELTSWLVPTLPFAGGVLRSSQRAKQFSPGERKTTSAHATGCEVCR